MEEFREVRIIMINVDPSQIQLDVTGLKGPGQNQTQWEISRAVITNFDHWGKYSDLVVALLGQGEAINSFIDWVFLKTINLSIWIRSVSGSPTPMYREGRQKLSLMLTHFWSTSIRSGTGGICHPATHELVLLSALLHNA